MDQMDVIKNKKEHLLLGRKCALSIKTCQSDGEEDHYDVVANMQKSGVSNAESSGVTPEPNKQYSNVNLASKSEENIYDEPMNENAADEKVREFKQVKWYKRQETLACRMCSVAIVIALVLIFACLSFLFAQFAETRAELDSFKQASNNQQVQINQSISQNSEEIENLEFASGNSFSILYRQLATLGQFSFNSAASCAALPLSSPSGYYWVRASNGSAVRVYCDMTRLCGGVTGGWMRVAELNMTNSSHQCPSGLMQSFNDSKIRTCVIPDNSGGCSSDDFDTADVPFSRICGRVVAYQFGSTNAFGFTGSTLRSRQSTNINTTYVDGVSLTFGIPKQHIWTFAAALDRDGTVSQGSSCPCQGGTESPPFVGNDYFCDTAIQRYNVSGPPLFQGDPLWDGVDCDIQDTCCSFNNPPWFFKQLPQPTTDDIEMRVCRDELSSNEDIAVEIIEIYTQ